MEFYLNSIKYNINYHMHTIVQHLLIKYLDRTLKHLYWNDLIIQYWIANKIMLVKHNTSKPKSNLIFFNQCHHTSY